MEIRVTKIVKASPERVFDVFSDITAIEKRLDGISRVEILSDVQHGVGTRWRETRVMLGREATEEMEISAFEPNRSYEVTAGSSGMAYHTTYDFTPIPEGTRVEMVFSGRPITLLARLMTPLAVLFKGTTRRLLEADMDALKRICESS